MATKLHPTLQKFAATRRQATVFDREAVARENWAKYLDAVQAAYTAKGKILSDKVLTSTALVLENLYNKFESLRNESTIASNVGAFIDYGFDLIGSFYPSLAAHEAVDVDPIPKRRADIFFQEFLYGTDRGDVRKGDTMFSPYRVGNGNTYYSKEQNIPQTLYKATADTTGAVTLPSIVAIPMVPGRVRIRVVLPTGLFTDFLDTPDGGNTTTGTLAPMGTFGGGNMAGSGTVNYATGALTLNLTSTAPQGSVITGFTSVSFEENPETIPEVYSRITSELVEAIPYKLRARYSLDAEYDLQQGHNGVSLNKALRLSLIESVRHSIDMDVFDSIRDGAALTQSPWSAVHRTNIAWTDQKEEFWDLALVPAKNQIFQATRKAEADVLVAGMGVTGIVETLPAFDRTAAIQNGPHVMGNLNGMKVIKNPFYDPMEYVACWKSPVPMEAGFKLCPYLPLYVTPTYTTDDLFGRFGLIHMSAFKMIFPEYFVKGSVVNTLPAGAAITTP